MDLMLLKPIAQAPSQYITHVHQNYLHRTPPRSPEPYNYYLSLIAADPAAELEYVEADVPQELKRAVKLVFGNNSSLHISYFLNATYLNLLPDPGPQTEPKDTQYRRWPMAPETERALKTLAMNEEVSPSQYITSFLTLPEIPESPVFLPKRRVTSYSMIKTSREPLRRLADFYDAAHLITHTNPRTLTTKAGYTLDYIISIS